MAYTFTRTGAQIEEIHNTVEDPKSNAQFSDDIRAIAGEYRGLWPDTGGSANKGDTYQTQVSGTGTGQYFTALQNTTVDPIGDNVNWLEYVSKKYVDNNNQSQDSLISSNSSSIASLGVRVANNESDISALQSGQNSGVIGYASQSDLYADLNHPEGAVAYVLNDLEMENNSTYRKVGLSGFGSWVQSSSDLASLAYQKAVNLEDYDPYRGVDDSIGSFMNQSGGLQSSSAYSVTGYMRVYGTGISITGITRGLVATIYCGAYDSEQNLLYTFRILPTSNPAPSDVFEHVYDDVNVEYVRITLNNTDFNGDDWKVRCVNITELPTDVIFEELDNKELRIRELESLASSSKLVSFIPELYQTPAFIKSAKSSDNGDFDGENKTVANVYEKFDELAGAHKPYFRKLANSYRSQVPDVGSPGYIKDPSVYDINHYELAKDGLSDTAPTIILAAAIHGYEFTGTVAVYYFIRDILENYNKSKMLQYIKDECRIIVVPLQNPWGWQNNWRENARQVDLNRNWDYNWADYAGGSKGDSPMSESESQSMLALINAYPSTFYLWDVHTRGEDPNPIDGRFTGYANLGDQLSKDSFISARNVVDLSYLSSTPPSNYVVEVGPNGGNPLLYRWAYYERGIASSNPEMTNSFNFDLGTLYSQEINRQQTQYIALLVQFSFMLNVE